MRAFEGRSEDLARLQQQLDGVRRTGAGRAIIMTGRRRVGKSRLVQEFCDRARLPYLVFQASRGRNPAAERSDLIDQITQMPLPSADLIAESRPTDWNGALRTMALVLPEDNPSIIVLDEVPWLVEKDPEFEGALQTVWDRYLASRQVLLILIGSRLSTMKALQEYGRPFFGRATWFRVRPLNPADVQDLTRTSAADAIDAYLITGGFPELVASWGDGTGVGDFLRRSVNDPLSPLLVAEELSLQGEFPEATHARRVLEAIGGSGERTFSGIARDAGGVQPLPSGTLAPILADLRAREVIVGETPLSTKAENKNRRYRIDDSYLRFWLAFLRRGVAESERGRGDLVLSRIERSWTSWRGRAVEPVIREALMRRLPDEAWPETEAIGGWWNRQNRPEIDLVGADRSPVARNVHFVGTIKWLEGQVLTADDYRALARDAEAVPGAGEASLVAVSRSGFADALPLAARWGPEELVSAWRSAHVGR